MSAPQGELVLFSWLNFVPFLPLQNLKSWCSVPVVASFPVDLKLLKVRACPSLVPVSVGWPLVMDGIEGGKQAGKKKARDSGQKFPQVGMGPMIGHWDSSGEILQTKQNKTHTHFHPPEILSVGGAQAKRFTLKLTQLKLQGLLPAQLLPGSWEGLQQFLYS